METKITSKSTKAEIMQAYEEAKKKLDAIEMAKDDPIKEKEKENINKTIESAEKLIGLGILNPEIAESYENLTKAIDMKKAELKDLYGIEKEANSFVALVNAFKDKQREQEEKAEETIQKIKDDAEKIKAEIEEEIEILKKKKENEKKQLQEDYQNVKNQIEKDRAREEEEYLYDLKRKRKVENDEWEDKKTQREKAIAEKEKSLDDRELDIISKEDHITVLEKEVAAIPDQVEEAYNKGLEKGKKDTEKSKAFEIRAIETKHEYEKKDLESQIARLTSDLTEAKEENKILQTKLDDAYAQMKELAVDTVKHVGGVKILDREASNTK